ncbi:MAG: DUF362 domain-containing protein [Clostridia bacterium]|nr:DUF362 domain-containing protein [Clostridia bacterium]
MPVAVRLCDNYESENVAKALDKALLALGGIEKYIKPGMKVLIKPNLLMPASPDKCTTTHPEITRAAIKAVKRAGAEPFLGECPGGTMTPAYLKATYRACGLYKVAEEEGCRIRFDFDEITLDKKDAVLEKRPKAASFLLEADAVISLCKLKTHGYMAYTGAVKNMFGIVPGIIKAQYHLKYQDVSDFAELLVDLYDVKKPVLGIMDAIYGMEGDGPSGGKPRKVGAVIVSDNCMELDYAASSMIGLDPMEVLTIKKGAQRGFFDPKNVIVDADWDTPICIKDFAKPSHMQRSMFPLIGNTRIGRFIERKFLRSYPKFDPSICVKCGICMNNCPPQALTMGEKAPKLDKNKCISCFCCHELCPKEAITIK